MAGSLNSSPLAILRIVPRKILPDRVFGKRFTETAVLNAATGPIFSLTSFTTSPSTSSAERSTLLFSTINPIGNCPFSLSFMPKTAHSATSL